VVVSGDNSGVVVESETGGTSWNGARIVALPTPPPFTYQWPPNTFFDYPLALAPWYYDGETL